ncbi:hybrid sensor histidine kinase/response regulator [Sulfuriflexus sp.]|uniref:hybrid sensor histidine kinase/response regulator n=1 Tax=Sulfuriflexus sp. TaxID=2015443 RepID=UPI0028CC8B7D|nr:hybrid sensor histidine kinase/response regulator [Sulfuriflexus sp.]MDT8403821.1 hybrid sensor histidine kinase/response regulator [Sulfuriflexus sp.]
MSNDKYNPATDPVMLDLYRQEVETNTRAITENLLNLERNNDVPVAAEAMMRAAHSIKGAARMVGFDRVVELAHTVEDCFVAAQDGEIKIEEAHIDILLKAVDMITDISEGRTETLNDEVVTSLMDSISAIVSGGMSAPPADVPHDNSAPDNDMLEMFRTDALSLSAKIDATIVGLEGAVPSNDELAAIQRDVHMFIGGAKLAGQDTLARFGTLIDEQLLAYIESNTAISAEAFATFQELLQTLIDWAAGDASHDLSNVTDLLARMRLEPDTVTESSDVPASVSKPEEPALSVPVADLQDTSIRISTRRMNRLVGLASENVVEARWVRSHADAMLVYRRRQTELIGALDNLRNYLDEANVPEHINEIFSEIQRRSNDSRAYLASRLTELEDFDRRVTGLSERLNHEVLQTRMRPFADCTRGFDRMLRDLARDLGKRVELSIDGGNTQVDREILTRIEAPLNHILRNAVDHGIESVEERTRQGKPASAKINITAAHNMGMLAITITDDGQGVNIDSLRQRIVDRQLVSAEMAANLNDHELLDFLYLPGFSTRSAVTEISGRGVGLDVVHNTIQEMRGQIRTSSVFGHGMRIQLMLPLTLSVIRSLLLEIGGQPYAIPLARISSIHTLTRGEVENIDGKQFFTLNGKHIGLVDAAQVLESKSVSSFSDFPIVVLGDRQTRYGLVVDRFLGERDLAVHILDSRLGKIRDISAATLLENGSPALIIDVDDIIRSIELLISGERLNTIEHASGSHTPLAKKTILVVDDSITVREVERKLLESRGYNVDVAVDGMDGWNTVQSGDYNLVISDVDMPRMNGIEFVTMLKNNSIYKSLPVMIVSYKDRQEDRDAGLQAGADYYLTKGSFHDDSLIEAVIDLIGEP